MNTKFRADQFNVRTTWLLCIFLLSAAILTFEIDTLETAAPTVTLLNDSGAADDDLVTNDGTLSVVLNETGSYAEYSFDGT